MSTTIDQRVVEMRFDNKQFEQNVSTTMSTLDKLKNSLKLTEASKGLENVGAAAKNCDVSVVGAAAEKVGLKFSAMYTMADQALRDITNSAMNAGKRIASALTIDPIKTGFSEYETQINAVQTILANTQSKGKTLDDVNGALDELNKYADKTIYNFTEMTRNIGTFTAAGVDLDTSVSAIKGIANLAAVSGSTSQQASTAMYQLSQAMASGTVKLMDWNSVVNAGMGGQVFQDALKETAKVHGVAIDDIINKQGSFRESLSEGWLTTEILTDTLAKFTGDLSKEQLKAQGYTDKQIEEIMKLGQTANDAATKVKTFTQLFDTLKEAAQSGWTQTWEILIGDFEEAKELLTQISDVVGGFIGKSADARNELLENWKVMGGRQDLIDSFKNIFEGLISIIKPIKEAFREIFPPATAEQLVAITKGLKEFTAKLKLSDEGSENLKRTFKGLFAILKLAGSIISAVFKAIGKLFGGVGELGGGILGVTASIGDFLVFLAETISYGNIFEKVFSGVATIINFVVKVIGKLVKGAANLFDFIGNDLVFPGLSNLIESLKDIFSGMSDVGDSASSMKESVANAFSAMGNAIKNSPIFKFFTVVWNGIKAVGSAIGKFLGNVFGGLLDRIANADILGVLEIVNGIISGGVGVALIKFFKNLGDSVGGFGDIAGSINDVLGSVSGALKGFQNSLNAEALKNIAIAIAILAGSILVLSFIDSEKLSDSLAAITILFAGLMGTMTVFSKSAGVTGMVSAAGSMLLLSAGVLVLSFALKSLAKLDIKDMSAGLLGVFGLMTIVVGAMKVLSKNDDIVIKGAIQIAIITVAVKMLASTLMELANLSISEMGVGLLGVFGLMAILVAGMKTFAAGQGDKIAKPFTKFIAQVTIIAAAIKVMAASLIDISQLDWEELGVGLAGMAGLMTLLVGSMKLLALGEDSSFTSTATALLAIAVSIRILIPAIEALGSMEWSKLGKAGVAFAGLLAAFAIFVVAIKMVKPENIKSAATSLLIISASLLILSGALKVFAGMSWAELGKAGSVLAAIVAVIALLGLESKLVNPGAINAMAASVAILAASLQMLIPSIVVLSLMSWESLGKAGAVLGGLVAALALLGLVSKYVNPGGLVVVAASLAILAVSLQMLVVPLALIGAMSWETLAMGLAVVAGSFVVLGIAGKLLMPLAPAILTLCAAISLLGVGVFALGAGLVLAGAGLASLGVGITTLAGSVASALVIIVTALVGIIPLAVQKLAEGVGQAIIAICKIITDGAPAIGEAAIALVLMLCDVLVECVPAIVDTVLVLVVKLLESLSNLTPQIVGSLVEFLVGILDSLAQHTSSLVTSLFNIIVAVLDGIADNIPVLIQSVVDIFMSIFEGAVDALSNIDTGTLLEGLMAIGLIAGIMAALAAVSSMIPQAMVGVLGMGVVIAELALVLAAIGALAQIPGLAWIVSEGGNFLQVVGTAIGQFIGGIIGGVAQGFTSSLPQIGTDLSSFMVNLQPFIEGAKTIDPSVVEGVKSLVSVILAITAANILEGIASFITGGSSISSFATQLPILGAGLKGFSDVTAGIVPENVAAAANAAKTLADMTNHIPKEGGVVAWFSGESSISKFAGELPLLGAGLKGFSDAVAGIVPENVTAAANAAKTLADMTAAIPDQGGVVSWFSGEGSISKFAGEIPILGAGLKGFSDAVAGIVPENVTAAANAAKTLADMTGALPEEGGVIAWFAGESSVSKFAGELSILGEGLKGFSDSTTGINPETMIAAANAAKTLADMTAAIPDQGGVVAWFAGESSISKFAGELPTLGKGLKGFSDSTTGINPETMTAAANAAQALADMTGHIPKEGGIKAWFSGESSISKFADKLPTLGKGLKGFSTSVAGINPDNVTAAANAAKSLAQMTETVPGETDKIITFGENLKKFGTNLAGYFKNTSGISSESISGSSSAVNAVKEITAIDSGKISSISTAINDMTTAIKNLANVPTTSTKEFVSSLEQLGEKSAKAFVEAFDDMDDDLKKKAKNAIDSFVSGVNGKKSTAKKAFTKIVEACVDAVNNKKKSFETAGKNLVQGLADGISANSYKAEAKAKAMAEAAAKAAKEALDINSPSKVFRAIGYSIPEGLAMGIDKLKGTVIDSAVSMTDDSVKGVKNSISHIADVINSDIDTQPTIRPVLDLSDVKSGANSISRMFDLNSSVGVMANVGSISSMMAQRNQNGANDDVVSAIKDLAKDIGNNRGDTYNFGNVSYDDDSSIAAAVRELVRAAKVERRV